jgi:predicted phosphodiesterase
MALSVAGRVARQYCEKYSATSTLAIARMLVSEQPRLFDSMEKARDIVRFHRGQHSGNNHQIRGGYCKNPVPFEIIAPTETKPILPIHFKHKGKGLIISDLHIPYHDAPAIKLALADAVKNKHTDFVLVNGDLLDFYQLSSFDKDPRNIDFNGELEQGKDFLATLSDMFGKVIYKMGNHEYRYERYLLNKAPELLGVEQFEMSKLLEQDDVNVEFIEHNRVIYMGEHLNILHGHEYGKGIFSPVNPARGMYLRASACTISGHLHRSSNHSEADIRGRVVSCW